MPDSESKNSRTKAIEDCIARDAIRQVLALYCRGIDRCDESVLRNQVYWPDATDDHGTFKGSLDEFIEWCMPQLRALAATHHHTSNPAIELRGDRALSECYWTGYHRMNPESGGEDYLVGGRYIDQFECRGAEWRIAKRQVVFDWYATTKNQDWKSFAFGDVRTIAKPAPHDLIYQASKEG